MKIERREPLNIYRKGLEDQPGERVWLATFIKYAVLALAGILLFWEGQAQALLERGYEALGGEVFALFLPFFYWMVSRIVKDLLNAKEGSGTWQ